MKFSSLIAAAFVAAAVAAPAMAAPTYYSTQASWEAAVGSFFTSTVPDESPFTSYGTGGSVTYDGVTYIGGADDGVFNVSPGFSGSPPVVSSQGSSPSDLFIALPGLFRAFAMYYGTFGGSSVSFGLSNGASTSQGSTGSGYAAPDFYGVIDTDAFSSVAVSTGDFVLNVNGVEYAEFATGGGVPEPMTWALMLVGFGGLGATLRRKRALAAA